MTAAENWLRAQGAAKVQLMVRGANDEVRHFYERRGYEDASVTVMARWLTPPSG
jgi:ribosomal protein S18 acetylase RimI-like enzyme